MAKETKELIKDSKVDKSEAVASTVSTAKPEPSLAVVRSSSHHYTDMAKITAGLFVGVLALMVFLLSVGLQHPKPMIRGFLYTAFVSLGLSLLAYQIGVMVESRATAKGADASGAKSLAAVRMIQQLIFAVAVISTVGFAIVASQLFFVPAAAATQTQSAQ